MPESVLMIVRNELWNDARVKKEAQVLRRSGRDVTIISRPEPGMPRSETWQGVKVLRPRYASSLTESLRAGFDGAEDRRRTLPARLAGAIRRNPVRRFLSDLFRNSMYEIKLFSAAVSARADIYHANDLDTLLISWAASRLCRARLVYDSHELWLGSVKHLRETSALGRLRDRLTERLLIGAADAVIAVTPGRGEVMRRMYPRMREPWIVENCPEPGAVEADGLLRSACGAPEGTPVVLYQGVLAGERGLEELLEAARLLRGRNLRIVLLGHDATGGRIPEMASAPDLSGIVTLLPPVRSEDLPRYTAGADAGLILFRNTCLNHYYSLPNKLYEYMNAAVPIIASDLPEIARVLDEEGCGLLVDPEDPSSIARGIDRMASDSEGRKAMAEKARAASAKHTWPAQARVLEALYDSLGKGEGSERRRQR